MPVSNCCFLTCIQVSQEAGKMVLYSYIFKNFPQFVVTHTIKGFSIVNETEVDAFLEFPCFLYDPMDVGNLISGFSAFSKPSLYIWNFSVHILLKPSLKDFEDFSLVCEMSSSPVTYWTLSDLGGSSSSVIYFCLVILFTGGILTAKILEWFAIPSSSGPRFVRTLHYDGSILGGPVWHGS